MPETTSRSTLSAILGAATADTLECAMPTPDVDAPPRLDAGGRHQGPAVLAAGARGLPGCEGGPGPRPGSSRHARPGPRLGEQPRLQPPSTLELEQPRLWGGGPGELGGGVPGWAPPAHCRVGDGCSPVASLDGQRSYSERPALVSRLFRLTLDETEAV